MLYVAGNKVNNIDVVYTPWANLKKTPSMDVGQVGFHNNKAVSLVYFRIYTCMSLILLSHWRIFLLHFGCVQVRTVRVEKRINEVVNRLNRTKVERKPDLKGTFTTMVLSSC